MRGRPRRAGGISERVVRGELAATQATLELLRWYGRGEGPV